MQADTTAPRSTPGQANLFTDSTQKSNWGLLSTVHPWDTGREQKVKPTAPVLTEFPGLSGTYSTILIDPPWRFINRTGKVAPEHRRLHRYETMSFEEIGKLPVAKHAKDKAHLICGAPMLCSSK